MDRRTENSTRTRQQVREAARFVFNRDGFSGARIEDIALEAQVSPATVYSTAGGKAGLLTYWSEEWSSDADLTRTHQHIERLRDPEAVIRAAVQAVLDHQQRWGDVIRVVRAAAGESAAAADLLALAVRRYREALRRTAVHLEDITGRRSADTADVLWFFLGAWGSRTLIVDCGWSRARTENWLTHSLYLTLDVAGAHGRSSTAG